MQELADFLDALQDNNMENNNDDLSLKEVFDGYPEEPNQMRFENGETGMFIF